ncbi:MAG: hypothetical protein GY790_23075 [Bacteroidetes bacterium]|nr:hypothetical protein [Bacteroidota bacterium]
MIRKYLIPLLLLLPVMQLSGQLTGNNLMEYQLGNLPYTEPSALSSHYDQLNLGYRYKGLRVSARYEHFLSQNQGSSYYALSQFQLQYRKDKLELKVGNFNETLGNGLLVRGYEIAGSVFEDEAYRTRYGFYRDMLGISAKYTGDIWYFQALRGKSLVNALPPTLELDERRIDLVEGLETGISLYSQTLGMILMRNSNPFDDELFYSLLFSGSIFGLLSYNLEYAHDIANDLPLLGMDEMSRYGLYGSIGFSIGSFGLSLEYKNYHNLFIGSGISDPPTAVRDHKFKVLNRSIHVPQLVDESGIQLEAYYSFPNSQHLLINYTRLVNPLFLDYRYNELFFEFSFFPGDRNGITLFADYASDELNFEDLRLAGGGIWDLSLPGTWSAQLHLEYQYIEREIVEINGLHNGVAILGFSKSPEFSLSIIWEASTDPYLADPSVAAGTIRNWPGVEASYLINSTNTLSLFAGKRRGGPACTSGICYEVLDFEGVELRLKTKF